MYIRSILAGQKKHVEEKRAKAARAQRALELCQGDLVRHQSDLARMEGQLKARDDYRVRAQV